MRDARDAFAAVRKYLALSDDKARQLTTKKYDEAQTELSLGFSGQKVVSAFDNSWDLVKKTSLGGRLPVSQSQKWKRKAMRQQNRLHYRHMLGIRKWLETNPPNAEQKMPTACGVRGSMKKTRGLSRFLQRRGDSADKATARLSEAGGQDLNRRARPKGVAISPRSPLPAKSYQLVQSGFSRILARERLDRQEMFQLLELSHRRSRALLLRLRLENLSRFRHLCLYSSSWPSFNCASCLGKS